MFSQPIGLLVACADVSDAQEVPRVAGPDVGEKTLIKLISRRRAHVEGPQEAREVY